MQEKTENADEAMRGIEDLEQLAKQGVPAKLTFTHEELPETVTVVRGEFTDAHTGDTLQTNQAFGDAVLAPRGITGPNDVAGEVKPYRVDQQHEYDEPEGRSTHYPHAGYTCEDYAAGKMADAQIEAAMAEQTVVQTGEAHENGEDCVGQCAPLKVGAYWDNPGLLAVPDLPKADVRDEEAHGHPMRALFDVIEKAMGGHTEKCDEGCGKDDDDEEEDAVLAAIRRAVPTHAYEDTQTVLIFTLYAWAWTTQEGKHAIKYNPPLPLDGREQPSVQFTTTGTHEGRSLTSETLWKNPDPDELFDTLGDLFSMFGAI